MRYMQARQMVTTIVVVAYLCSTAENCDGTFTKEDTQYHTCSVAMACEMALTHLIWSLEESAISLQRLGWATRPAQSPSTTATPFAPKVDTAELAVRVRKPPKTAVSACEACHVMPSECRRKKQRSLLALPNQPFLTLVR